MAMGKNDITRQYSLYWSHFHNLHDLGRLMLLCADTELKHLYHSKYIVCDGTFQTAPESSYQGYMEMPLPPNLCN